MRTSVQNYERAVGALFVPYLHLLGSEAFAKQSFHFGSVQLPRFGHCGWLAMFKTLGPLCSKPFHRKLIARRYSEVAWRNAIASKNSDVNALVFVPETVDHGADGLPLTGMQIAVKDNICTKEMPTTCSSLMLREFTSPFDATAVQLLRQAGASVVGKANCDEFGMG